VKKLRDSNLENIEIPQDSEWMSPLLSEQKQKSAKKIDRLNFQLQKLSKRLIELCGTTKKELFNTEKDEPWITASDNWDTSVLKMSEKSEEIPKTEPQIDNSIQITNKTTEKCILEGIEGVFCSVFLKPEF